MMPKGELDELLHAIGAIAAVEAAKAYNSPGTVAGSVLRPYVTSTLRMEPSGVYTIYRPDGDVSAANGQAAIPILVDGWLKELGVFYGTARFDEAVSFIKGPAIKAAESYASSHR